MVEVQSSSLCILKFEVPHTMSMKRSYIQCGYKSRTGEREQCGKQQRMFDSINGT